MAEERNYIIPLRKHWRKAPVYKRSNRKIHPGRHTTTKRSWRRTKTKA